MAIENNIPAMITNPPRISEGRRIFKTPPRFDCVALERHSAQRGRAFT
jgi:hypothetical protein